MTASTYAGTAFTFSELNQMNADTRNEVLAIAILDLDSQLKALQAQRSEASRFLLQEMQQKRATVMVVGDFKVTVEENVKWEYEVEEGLIQLTAFGVTQEEYDACIQKTYKVDKSMLNAFKARGESIEKIIDQHCTRIVTSSRAVVSQKKATREKSTPRVFSEHEKGVPAEWS